MKQFVQHLQNPEDGEKESIHQEEVKIILTPPSSLDNASQSANNWTKAQPGNRED